MATAASARYASSPCERQQRHGLLADYFLGTWAATPKALNLTEGIVLEKCLRGVPAQCLRLPHSRRVNRRFLDELWRHLVGARRSEEALAECLLNPDWLAARCATSGCGALVRDLRWAAEELGAAAGAGLAELALSFAPLRSVVDCDGERLLEQLLGQLRSDPRPSAAMSELLERLAGCMQSSALPQLLPTRPCLLEERRFLLQRRRLRVVDPQGFSSSLPVAAFGSAAVLAVDLHRRRGCSLLVLSRRSAFANYEREVCVPETVTSIEATFPESDLVLVRTVTDRSQAIATFSFDLVDLSASRCMARSAFGFRGRCLMAASDIVEWRLAAHEFGASEVTIWDVTKRPFALLNTLVLPPGSISISRLLWSRSGRWLIGITESPSLLVLWNLLSCSSSLPGLPFDLSDVTRGLNDQLVLCGQGLAFLEPSTGHVTYPKDIEDRTLPVSSLIGSDSGAYLLALCDGHPVRVWDVEERQLVSEVPEYRCEDLQWVSFFNEHRWLVVTCDKCDNFATIWVFGSGSGNFYPEALRLRAIGLHDAPILGFAFHRLADLAVSFGRDRAAMFWSSSAVQDDAFSQLFKARQLRRRSHASGVTAAKALEVTEPLATTTTGLVILQKYKVLAVGRSNGCLSFFNLPATEAAPRKAEKTYPWGITDMRACGRWLAFKVGAFAAYVWDVKSLTEFHRFEIDRKELSGIALGANLLAISRSGAPSLVRCFELPSGDIVEDIDVDFGIEKLEMAPDESFLAANAGNLPVFLPRASSAPSPPLDPFASSAPLLCFLLSPDADLLVTGDASGAIRVLSASRALLTSFRQAAPVAAAAFLPPCGPGALPRLVTAGHRQLFVWALAEPRVERAISRHTARPTLLATSPDGGVLASCGEDRHLILWSSTTWGCLASFDLRCHVTCMALGPAGAAVFVAGDPRVAPFTALAPNTCLTRLLTTGPSRPATAALLEEEEEDRLRPGPELFKTKAEAIAGTFSGAARAAESEVCRLL